jgi:hypothetical protein
MEEPSLRPENAARQLVNIIGVSSVSYMEEPSLRPEDAARQLVNHRGVSVSYMEEPSLRQIRGFLVE